MDEQDNIQRLYLSLADSSWNYLRTGPRHEEIWKQLFKKRKTDLGNSELLPVIFDIPEQFRESEEDITYLCWFYSLLGFAMFGVYGYGSKTKRVSEIAKMEESIKGLEFLKTYEALETCLGSEELEINLVTRAVYQNGRFVPGPPFEHQYNFPKVMEHTIANLQGLIAVNKMMLAVGPESQVVTKVNSKSAPITHFVKVVSRGFRTDLGQPLYSTVANITNCIFQKHKIDLTREDVRNKTRSLG